MTKQDEYRRDVPPGIEETATPPQAAPIHLYAAIHAAQARIETVRKNGQNPHFKSKYATLDEVWESVKRPLSDAGLIVICDIRKDGEERVLRTRLVHAQTGEEAACEFPLSAAAASPQAVGSALTYARRYTLTALLEIVTCDGADDDGAAATPPAKADMEF